MCSTGGGEQDESSKLTEYAEKAAKEIKRRILAKEEISQTNLLNLKEAQKAEHLAELFVPVANTDSAREAAEIVKNAVTKANVGATKVKEASSVLKSAISQTIVESSRAEAATAKKSAEANANIAKTVSAN